jgi:serine-type D-Ala-D-Ala carboxypeptidase/endopeptidase (penicillin-binding protein 4)
MEGFRRRRVRGSAPLLVILAAACSQATRVVVAPPAPTPPPVAVTSAPAPVTIPPPPPPRTSTAGDPIIDSIISADHLERVGWGIEVFDPATSRLLYRSGAERHFIPASNTKLVATSAAMALLGPDWRYRTDVHASGDGPGGAVESLVIVGRGDPTMSSRFFANDFTVMSSLADSISHAGVRRVTHGVIIDASYFDDNFLHPVWEVGDLRSSDAAPVAAFAIGEGSFRAVVRAGNESGQPASLHVVGPPGLVRVRSAVVTGPPDSPTSLDEKLAGDTIIFTGTIPLNAPGDTQQVALVDPVAYAGAAFVAMLRERNIDVAGGVRIVYDSLEARRLPFLPNSRLVASWESPPLREIVAGLMKPSANWIAEQLCKTLGAERNGRGSWPACVRAEAPFLLSAGLDSTAFFLRDGSGLAAQNLLTPHAIVQLLEYDRRAPWGEDYRRSLAEPGEKGTLQRRLLGLKGRLWAKTGSITNVNSLSGYLQTDSGKMLIFSILSNGSGRSASEVRRAMDEVVLRMTNAW